MRVVDIGNLRPETIGPSEYSIIAIIQGALFPSRLINVD